MSRTPTNLDHILSALYRRLANDPVLKAKVRQFDKGPRRRTPAGHKRPPNPSVTVNVISAPIDPEVGTIRCTAIVNMYGDALSDGRMDVLGLGDLAARVVHLLHEAHLPTHPEGRLEHEGLRFLAVYVQDSIPLPSDLDNEFLMSVRVSLIVERKGE